MEWDVKDKKFKDIDVRHIMILKLHVHVCVSVARDLSFVWPKRNEDQLLASKVSLKFKKIIRRGMFNYSRFN